MTTEPFSHDEVIKNTARRMNTKPEVVEQFLAAYADEYVRHARNTEPALIRPVTPEPPKAPRKAAKAKTAPAPQTEGEKPAEASTEGAPATAPAIPGAEFSSAE